MQVYNLILKILKTQLGQIIMYIAIFTTITSVVSSQMASNDSQSFQETKQKISIQDSDQSEASTALSSYLSKTNELIELKDYNTITIQDELYNRNTTNVILIPSGFEQFLVNGQITELLDVYNIPGNTTSDLIKRDIDCFIHIVSSYLSAGIPLTDSLNYTNTTTEKSVTIDLLSQTSLTNDGMYAFFSYIAYIFIALAIVAVSPILLIMNRSEIRNRIFCSSYCNARINFEISLGIALIGLLICIGFTILSLITFKSDLFSINGILNLLNMFIFMIVALSMAYLIGLLVKNETSISMVGNILGLGCSFLGGIFVPISMLSEGVIRLAHFLPTYWYTQAINLEDLTLRFQYMGIQLVFACMFFVVGAAVMHLKRTAL